MNRRRRHVAGAVLVALAACAACACAAVAADAAPALTAAGPSAAVTARTATAGVPEVTGLSPASVVAGEVNFGVTVVGSGFVAGSTVLWNGQPRDTGFISDTMLTATVLAADVATPGSAFVSVRNPAPGGTSAGARVFTVLNPVPSVTALEPTEAWAGGPGVSLVVTGARFMPTSVILVAGNDTPTRYVSSERLEALVPDTSLTHAAPLVVRVFTPAPGGGLSGPLSLEVRADDQPPVTTVTGLKSLWNRGPVTLKLVATDVGLGVMKTFYRFRRNSTDNRIGTTVKILAPADHSSDGLHLVQYFSVDIAANVEETKEVLVGIDTTPPVTSVSAATVKRGGSFTPRYQVSDALSAHARDALLQICDARGRVVQSAPLGQPATRTWVTAPALRVDLSKGTYRLRVLAHDLAGNAQSGTKTATLVVK